jgi:hypothetical protein
MLEEVSHNLMVYGFCCCHQGRPAIFCRLIDVDIELLDQALHHFQSALLSREVQGSATIFVFSVGVCSKLVY